MRHHGWKRWAIGALAASAACAACAAFGEAEGGSSPGDGGTSEGASSQDGATSGEGEAGTVDAPIDSDCPHRFCDPFEGVMNGEWTAIVQPKPAPSTQLRLGTTDPIQGTSFLQIEGIASDSTGHQNYLTTPVTPPTGQKVIELHFQLRITTPTTQGDPEAFLEIAHLVWGDSVAYFLVRGHALQGLTRTRGSSGSIPEMVLATGWHPLTIRVDLRNPEVSTVAFLLHGAPMAEPASIASTNGPLALKLGAVYIKGPQPASRTDIDDVQLRTLSE